MGVLMQTSKHTGFFPSLPKFLAGLLCLGFTGALGAQKHSASEPRRPNILFVVADDLGAWAVGAYGKPNCHTPHLDRLATEGIVFENAFSVSAVCSPSWAALLTSRYPTETGIVDTLVSEDGPGLAPEIAIWPQLLQSAGYETALIGSWALGGGRDVDLPTQRGYGEFSGFLWAVRVSREPAIQFLAPGQVRRSDVRVVDYEKIPGEHYTDEVLTDLAIDFMRRSASSDKPFALSVHLWAPHANTAFPKDFTLPYKDRSWLPLREDDLTWWRGLRDDGLVFPDPQFPNLDSARLRRMMREYHSSVHGIDRNIGRLLAFLNDPNGDGSSDDSIAANTVVIVTSDHGYMMGHHGMWHKGNGRWLTADRRDPVVPRLYGDDENRTNMFDASLKVPCIVRWPARISRGLREAGVITHLDWLPTLAAIGGTKLDTAQPVRGTAIAALAGTASNGEDTVFGQYRKLRMLRSNGWKLVRHFENPKGDELYNLEQDPDEKTNLIHDSRAPVVAVLMRLDHELRSRMKAVGDPICSDLPMPVE